MVASLSGEIVRAHSLKCGFAILTRADPQPDDSQYAGLSMGEALIIRKADGRATDDAIESLVLSHKLLGMKKWIVIHYIGDDEAPLFDEAATDTLLDHSDFAESQDGSRWTNSKKADGNTEAWNAAWTNFWAAASQNYGTVAKIVREDVNRVRNHPRTPADVEVEGYIQDVKTGTFSRV